MTTKKHGKVTKKSAKPGTVFLLRFTNKKDYAVCQRAARHIGVSTNQWLCNIAVLAAVDVIQKRRKTAAATAA